MHFPDFVVYSSGTVSIDEICVTKRGDPFDPTVVYLLELLQVYVRGLCERYGTFEDQAKEKSGKQICT